MSIKLIPEILDELKDCKTEVELKTVLLANRSPALKWLFQYVFRKDAVFSFDKLPSFRPDPGPMGLNPSSLYYEIKRFYVLLEATKIPLKKKRELLIQILERIHPSEAEVVGQMLKHDLGIPLLTEKLVRETLFNEKQK
jgi:hypothetical protein